MAYGCPARAPPAAPATGQARRQPGVQARRPGRAGEQQRAAAGHQSRAVGGYLQARPQAGILRWAAFCVLVSLPEVVLRLFPGAFALPVAAAGQEVAPLA